MIESLRLPEELQRPVAGMVDARGRIQIEQELLDDAVVDAGRIGLGGGPPRTREVA